VPDKCIEIVGNICDRDFKLCDYATIKERLTLWT